MGWYGRTNLVVLEHSKLDLLVLVLLLLGLRVRLLLTLLGTSKQTQKDVEGILLSNPRFRQLHTVIQLLALKQHPLCIERCSCRPASRKTRTSGPTFETDAQYCIERSHKSH
jgi:hypothetical protein